jgi:predicted dehydrogenase
MQPTNVAIISAGGAGRAQLHRFGLLPDANVKTIFDINEKTLRYLSDKYPLKIVTNDYNQVIEDDDIDVVSTCSPDHPHFGYSRTV